MYKNKYRVRFANPSDVYYKVMFAEKLTAARMAMRDLIERYADRDRLQSCKCFIDEYIKGDAIHRSSWHELEQATVYSVGKMRWRYLRDSGEYWPAD